MAKQGSEEHKKKTSDAIKKWWANRTEEDIITTRRKMSATRHEIVSKIPPRAKRDMYKKKSRSQREHYTTYLGHINRLYIGYLAKKDILECPPEKKECITAKKIKGIKKAWANCTPERRQERLRGLLRYKKQSDNNIKYLHDYDVPRETTYCGVIEEEKMYG